MLPYFLTAGALKAASANSLTRSTYRNLGKLKNNTPCHVSLESALWCMDGLPPQPQRLLDLGTGWIHTYTLFPALLRDDELHCFDVADIRKLPCFRATLPLIYSQIQQWLPIEDGRRDAASKRFAALQNTKSFRDVYQIINLTYQCRSDGIPNYPADYFDRIFSVDVLEHVDADLFPSAAAAWFRILKPGGDFRAQVGIDDHLAHYQGHYGSKRYLRYSEKVWKRLLENKVQYVNRLTKSQLIDNLTRAGFIIDEVESDLAGEVSPADVHPDYHWQCEEDIRAVRLCVKAHKPPLEVPVSRSSTEERTLAM